MIRYDVKQGSQEWLDLRLGIPTASQFHRIITAKTLKPSAAAQEYIHELIAEWALGEPLDEDANSFMLRGSTLEQEAVDWYEFTTDRTIDRVGFCTTDDGRVGCSPDGLVGNSGGLEIKCPGVKNHIGYLVGSPAEKYKAQIQGGLWVCEREWWEIISYNPELPQRLVRVERDEKFITALAERMEGLLERLEAAKEEMRKLGVNPAGGESRNGNVAEPKTKPAGDEYSYKQQPLRGQGE